MSNDNKFKNGKIYTLRNKNDDTLIYVGSTIQPLYKRYASHKAKAKTAKDEKDKNANMKLYIKMNETDYNDWYIELYEDFPCECKEQLNKREGEIIREIGTLNKNIPGTTIKEQDKKKYEKNKEKIAIRQKEYNIKNKERIKEIQHEKYEKYKEKYKEKIKEYYIKNKERILLLQKEYLKNKKIII